ncbi:MAG TPA: asparagine synthase (glutamine-hydrolyzing) [Thermomicrobiaceae bacterium]|nr:asparagine synthase (glutamine-hydrolyzing) [Thermomicrobiaceae bacterium]
MCGICGIYDYRDGQPAEPFTLRRMADAMRHRGPDDDGAFVDGGLGLGFRRLSIIDLAGGHQPMFNEDDSVVLVFNGEIYNYRELRDELLARGHAFQSNSDTEVIVHLYEEVGEACVERLRGMFGFALWDSRRRRLLLARDRLGIKPLYYTDFGGRLLFGSEIKAILEHPAVERRLDMDALGNFLALKYVPAPQTMFQGIRALEPGQFLVCDEDGVRLKRYWDLSFQPQHPARREAEYAEELGALLRETVRMHLMSDVPFGAFLSGGLDSSTVVALMSEVLEQPVKTFAVVYEGEGAAYSEAPYARAVARRYGADHHEVTLTARDFMTQAERVIWHLDQPIADEAAVANFMVSRLAAEHVKMVLTGEGGDELFAGYARYSGERLSPLARRSPSVVRRAALAGARRLPGLRGPKLALYALAQPDEVRRFSSWFPLFNAERRAQLLTPECASSLDAGGPERVIAAALARADASEPLNRMLYVDSKLWLPDDLLARGDKTSMAASLEARVPLLDHKLVEFAAALPPSLKLHRLTRKYLLRKVAAPLLPPEIIERRKKGFAIPTSVWFRGEARDWVREILATDVLRQRGLFVPEYVASLLDEHERGFADHGQLIWGLLGVELWQRQYLDGTRPRVESAVFQLSGGGANA